MLVIEMVGTRSSLSLHIEFMKSFWKVILGLLMGVILLGITFYLFVILMFLGESAHRSSWFFQYVSLFYYLILALTIGTNLTWIIRRFLCMKAGWQDYLPFMTPVLLAILLALISFRSPLGSVLHDQIIKAR
jgi:hypothetical protein